MKIKYEETSKSFLERQESLSKEILDSLEATYTPTGEMVVNRPESNFIDLMNWTQTFFSKSLKDKKNLNKYVHNKIVIDGEFLLFAKENNISIECLYKDSYVSWRSDDFEKFFAQGVFLIKARGVEFLHAALFHKGSTEDEVSFFVIVSNDNFQKYIDLRNSFEDWAKLKDRNSNYIRVIGGGDIFYERNNNVWDDVFFPSDLKNEIKKTIENFLSSKDFYLSNKIPWKNGILLWGPAGCGKSSVIKTVISNYNFKPVTIFPGSGDQALQEAFSYAEEQSPSLLFFEDLDSMLEEINISLFLNLMDGVAARNGIFVIATANDISRFKPNITDRPSRFDRKFQIPLPNQEMTVLYLKKWFGTTVSIKEIRELAKHAVKHGFSYAYLKDLYISSMFEALSNNRKTPISKDIEKTVNRLVKEKNMLNYEKLVDTDRYFK